MQAVPGATWPLQAAELPDDAVEVGRVQDAWGIKGWFKVQPYSASPEALFSSKRWFLLPPARGARHFDGPQRLPVRQVKAHGDAVVASAQGVDDRDAADLLKGARIFIARSSFPTPAEGEYYWVDLIGLAVFNLAFEGADGKPQERLIPFVSAYVDEVDLAAGRITVDWQPDY